MNERERHHAGVECSQGESEDSDLQVGLNLTEKGLIGTLLPSDLALLSSMINPINY